LDLAALLGRRTGELHLSLASINESSFAPEPYTVAHQRGLYQTARKLLSRTFLTLRRTKGLPEGNSALVRDVLAQEKLILENLQGILNHPIAALRIRCHGDYHLGQVLYTGKDFVLIDFEGAPDRPFASRRTKETPLSDVAGMVRSLHAVAIDSLARFIELGGATPSALSVSRAAVDYWYYWNASAFVKGYRATIGDVKLMPDSEAGINRLLQFHMMVRTLNELHYDLTNRPTNITTPLYGILELLAS
jgi:maltose alpha-D-glucosyltransferase/alpha-amylase